MKIFLADTNNQNHRSANHWLKKVGLPHHALFSYYYYDQIDLDDLMSRFEQHPIVFADSGAFSAYSLGGKRLDVYAYGDWVLQNKHHFWVYANLDEKRETTAENVMVGQRNQKILEDMGLNPLPVYHTGEPWEVLADYIKDYDYIALGGTAGMPLSEDAIFRSYAKAFSMAEPGRTKYHGFGATAWKSLVSFPWYTVDSSSWGAILPLWVFGGV